MDLFKKRKDLVGNGILPESKKPRVKKQCKKFDPIRKKNFKPIYRKSNDEA